MKKKLTQYNIKNISLSIIFTIMFMQLFIINSTASAQSFNSIPYSRVVGCAFPSTNETRDDFSADRTQRLTYDAVDGKLLEEAQFDGTANETPQSLTIYCYDHNNLKQEVQMYERNNDNILIPVKGTYFDTYEFIGQILGTITFNYLGDPKLAIVNRYEDVRFVGGGEQFSLVESRRYKAQTTTSYSCNDPRANVTSLFPIYNRSVTGDFRCTALIIDQLSYFNTLNSRLEGVVDYDLYGQASSAKAYKYTQDSQTVSEIKTYTRQTNTNYICSSYETDLFPVYNDNNGFNFNDCEALIIKKHNFYDDYEASESYQKLIASIAYDVYGFPISAYTLEYGSSNIGRSVELRTRTSYVAQTETNYTCFDIQASGRIFPVYGSGNSQQACIALVESITDEYEIDPGTDNYRKPIFRVFNDSYGFPVKAILNNYRKPVNGRATAQARTETSTTYVVKADLQCGSRQENIVDVYSRSQHTCKAMYKSQINYYDIDGNSNSYGRLIQTVRYDAYANLRHQYDYRYESVNGIPRFAQRILTLFNFQAEATTRYTISYITDVSSRAYGKVESQRATRISDGYVYFSYMNFYNSDGSLDRRANFI